jgi:hypothetical protein
VAGKLLIQWRIMGPITSGGDLKLSKPAVRHLPKRKPSKKTKRGRKTTAAKNPADENNRAAVGTLTRTKSLLLAALKVWELKQGIRD